MSETAFRPSFWETDTLLRRADLAVIGAGLTGLQAAIGYKAAHPRAEVVVLERGAISRGASTRNAGFACFGSPTELLADWAAHGPAATLATVRARYAGVRALEARYADGGIDWQQHGGYELIDDPDTAERVREQLPALNALLAEATGQAQTWRITAERPHLVLYNNLEAQLHPGKLVERLLEEARRAGIRLLFGCTVADIEAGAAAGAVSLRGAGWGELTASRCLVATNAFVPRLLPGYAAPSVRPVRNQVMLSRPLEDLALRGCYHYHEGYVYFRNVGPDRLLIGGGRHRAGPAAETDAFGDHPAVRAYLLGKLNEWFPERKWRAEDFPQRWSGILAQGAGKGPLLEFAHPNVLVAARLAGMGVALSAELARRAVAALDDAAAVVNPTLP